MSSISSISSASTSSLAPIATSQPAASAALEGSGGGSAMSASISHTMQSGDPMQMLVALMMLNVLFGDGEGKDKASEDLLGALAGLAMLGAAGAGMSQSTSIMMAQQSAPGAYAASSTLAIASSSFSATG